MLESGLVRIKLVSEQFGLRAMAAFNPAQLDLLQEMKELLNSATKKLDRMMLRMNQQQEEATMKKTLRGSFSIMDVDSVCDGNDLGLSVIAADELDLIEDEEIEASLADGGEDGPELLGDEGSKPDLINIDGFKVSSNRRTLSRKLYSRLKFLGLQRTTNLVLSRSTTNRRP